MANRIFFDINDVAAGPEYEICTGLVSIDKSDEDTLSYVEALVKLGFSPEIVIIESEK